MTGNFIEDNTNLLIVLELQQVKYEILNNILIDLINIVDNPKFTSMLWIIQQFDSISRNIVDYPSIYLKLL